MKGYYYIMVLVVFSACNKPESRSCFKFVGNETTIEIPMPSFDKLKLHEHIEFTLIQDSLDKLVITGGRNLISFVKAEVNDGLLEIHNENKCNFLRSYKKKIKVEIHFTTLQNLHYLGTETLVNLGQLKLNWFTFTIQDGAGPVDLNLDAQTIYASISHGWGDFTFRGKTKFANLNVRSNGFCDTYGLQITDSLTVISRTQGDIKVNTDGVPLRAEINEGGSIYYKGIPQSVKFNNYGSGSLINAN